MDTTEQLDKLISETVMSADVLENIRNIMEVMVQKLDKFATAKVPGSSKALGSPGAPGSSKGEDSGGIIGTVKGFAGAISGALAGLLAFIALPPLMTAAVLPFVRALNPGLVEQFDQMLSNLQATIGYGLEPIIAQAARTLREWSGMLMPVMRELRPVVAEVAKIVSDVLLAVLGQLVFVVRLTVAVFGPVIKLLGVLISVWAQLAEVTYAVIDAVGSLIDEFLASVGLIGGVDEALKEFKTVIGHCLQGLAALATALLKVALGAEAVSRFRQALEKRIADKKNPAGGMAAAPKDVGTGDIEGIAKKMSERAFAAQTGATAKSDTEILEEILKGVKFAEDFDLFSTIKNAVRDGMKAAKDEVVNTVPGVKPVKDMSSNPVGMMKFLFNPIGALNGAF